MAGRGFAPKPEGTRARRNKEPGPLRIVPVTPDPQPPLPKLYTYDTGPDGALVRREYHWPAITRRWWKTWGEHPLAKDFTDIDWAELLVAARLHAEFWKGNTKVAAELRLRVAKFGATLEDRARLRITFALADRAENGEQPTEQQGPRPAGRTRQFTG